MLTTILVIALGVFAAWNIVKMYLPEWLWLWVPPVIVTALAYGDYEAPRAVQVVAAAIGLFGLINVIRGRIEREEIIIDRRRR